MKKSEEEPMTWLSRITGALLIMVFVSLLPLTAQAKIDWKVADAVQLSDTPVAVARTQEGDLTFILTDQAKVIIYGAEGKIVGTVPVDPSVTDIAVSPRGEELYLINGKRKNLQTIAISFIVDFNVADSPFLGPPGAKVVVAVFSDFQ